MSVGGGSGGTMCFKFNHASNNFFSDKQCFLFLADRLKFVTHHKLVHTYIHIYSYIICCITGRDTHNKNIL
jgi:hypothetical protein